MRPGEEWDIVGQIVASAVLGQLDSSGRISSRLRKNGCQSSVEGTVPA